MKAIEIDISNRTVTEVEITSDQEMIRDLIGEYNMAAMSVDWLGKYFTGIVDHVMYTHDENYNPYAEEEFELDQLSFQFRNKDAGLYGYPFRAPIYGHRAILLKYNDEKQIYESVTITSIEVEELIVWR